MKIHKHIKLIRKLANHKSRKLINEADKRVNKIQHDYLRKIEKHDRIFDARLKYCENLREKTEKQCDLMIQKTTDKCREMEQRRRAVLLDTIKQNNEVQKRAKNIENKYESVRSLFSETTIEAHKSDSAADESARINRVN